MKSHKYRDLNEKARQAIFDGLMFDSWSFSKVATFTRNEKDFERTYIYNEKGKMSSTGMSGRAYHYSLEHFFNMMIEGADCDIVDLETKAFDYVDSIAAYVWKIQKSTPTIDDCIIKTIKTSKQLLENFFSEIGVYTKHIKKVLFVERKIKAYLTINGVDIPIPCHMMLDLVIETFDGKIVIIDHKSCNKFASDEELILTTGKQAITYVKGLEAECDLKVDEVWFIHNKYSKNRDKTAQLKSFKIKINDDARRLYEAQLYEPLKRMIEAISDPDYVYIINESDNFVDKAELHNFWCRVQMSEVSDFEISESKRALIEKRLKKIRNSNTALLSPTIIKNFEKNAAQFIQYDLTNKNMTKEEKIEHILRTFGIITKVAHSFRGYSSDTFLLEVSAGVKISNLQKYKLDIANILNVANIRMLNELFVYNDKSYVSIEVSKKREKDLMLDTKKLIALKIPIGIDNFGNTIFWDLNNQSTPHVLVGGSTGSGKSEMIRSIIYYAKLAKIKQIIILDPKCDKVFKEYIDIVGISVVRNILKTDAIENSIRSIVEEMRHRVVQGIEIKTLVIFDEVAEAIANSKKGNELKVYENQVIGHYKSGVEKTKKVHIDTLASIEQNLKQLTQLGRSSGYRVLAATQRASVGVITGDAKVNFPVRICFRVPTDTDSNVILDESGAECLAGAGDGLMRSPEYLNTIRFQGFYKK